MSIAPDDKDWTWVLERPCPECGYDARGVSGRDVPMRLREQVPLWNEALSAPSADVRSDPSTWSTLEYACHVRDVCTLFSDRLQVMLTDDDAQFANWDQDATAVEGQYDKQVPLAVAAELASSAEMIATDFDAVAPGDWVRKGRRSDGTIFSVETFAKYFLHDVVHHGWDVTQAPTP